ncbi:MAG: hypothetical protein ACK4UJ_04855 [Leptonema sp. (in: bacteria)]
MKTFNYGIILFFLLTFGIESGPKEGVMSEFRAVEEGIRKQFRSEKEQQTTLEKNLLNAMKMAIMRRFYYDSEKYLKELNVDNLSWESPTTPNIYYVKFKYFIVRFDFANDPKFFIQSPIFEKFLIMSEFEEGEHDKINNPPNQPTQPTN